MIAGLRRADKSLFHKPDLLNLFSIMFRYRQHLRVVGNSMKNILSEGDLIRYKKIDMKNLDLKVGDIVVASHPKIKSQLIIKRIYQIHQNKFDLRGDNPLESSDSREWGLIELDLIVGKVDKIFTQ